MCVHEGERDSWPFGSYFYMVFFFFLPYVNWANQDCYLFYLRSLLWSSDCWDLTWAMTGSTGHTRPKPQVLVSMSHNSGKPHQGPRWHQGPPWWPKVESITTRQLHYCWDKGLPLYKQLWFRAQGSHQDSTVLDETWPLARASNKPFYALALLWMSYSLIFASSDTA